MAHTELKENHFEDVSFFVTHPSASKLFHNGGPVFRNTAVVYELLIGTVELCGILKPGKFGSHKISPLIENDFSATDSLQEKAV